MNTLHSKKFQKSLGSFWILAKYTGTNLLQRLALGVAFSIFLNIGGIEKNMKLAQIKFSLEGRKVLIDVV